MSTSTLSTKNAYSGWPELSYRPYSNDPRNDDRRITMSSNTLMGRDLGSRRANLYESRWSKRVGWKLSIRMISCYVSALFVAIAHYFFFTYLDGRRVDLDTNIPQSFVAPISIFLTLLSQLALRTCIDIGYRQHLWRTTRRHFNTIGDLDRLFGALHNFQGLLNHRNFRVSWILTLCAALYWLAPLPGVFPTGAIVVQGRIFSEQTQVDVPTFEIASLGNGTNGDVLQKQAIAPLLPLRNQTINVEADNNLINAAAISQVLDDIIETRSPCGSNCSYSISFEGPIAKCNSTSFNDTTDGSNPAAGLFLEKADTFDPNLKFYNGVRVGPQLTFTLLPRSAWAIREDNTSAETELWMYEQTIMKCQACRAKYDVQVNYTRDFPTYKVETTFIDCVEDFWQPIDDPETENPSGTFPTTSKNLNYLRGANLVILFDSFMRGLSGDVRCILDGEEDGEKVTLSNVELRNGPPLNDEQEAIFLECRTEYNSTNNFIQQTPFNANRNVDNAAISQFEVTEDMINKVVANITLSAMNRLDRYKTSTNATQMLYYNIFSFENPARLLVPYFVMLGITLPFIIIGMISLWENGENAPTDGFLGTILSTAGSAGLQEVVAGSLDKNQRVEKEQSFENAIKSMRIRYGELPESDSSVRRLGFGTEDEVGILRDKK